MKIKVILLDTIKGVGKKDQIVDVKDGYANNFLLPQKKAVLATTENINKLQQKNNKKINDEKKDLANAKELKALLDGKKIVLNVKAGDNGKVFGSIGPKELLAEIKSQLNIDLDKKLLTSDDRIKELGVHKLVIKLHKDVSSVLNVEVRGL